MWGIVGYQPDTVTTVDGLLARYAAPLAALVGRPLVQLYGLVLVGERDWCPALPIVADLDGHRLELGVSGLDRLHLSWNTIDLAEVPDADYQDDPEREVEWAALESAELRPVLGHTVSDVWVLEYVLRLDPPVDEPPFGALRVGAPPVDELSGGDPSDDETSGGGPAGCDPYAGGPVEAWLIGGLELVFANGVALQLHRYRAELMLGDAEPGCGPWRRYDLPMV